MIDLVQSARRGDPRAREALARWCLPRIRRTIWLAVGPGPDVDDLAQTVITRVFAHLASYRAEARFHVWVDRIAVNAIRDHWRAQGRAWLTEYDDGRELRQRLDGDPYWRSVLRGLER